MYKKKVRYIGILFIVIFILVSFLIVIFRYKEKGMGISAEERIDYKYHYAMIVSDSGEKYEDFYSGVYQASESQQIYVENFRKNFVNFSTAELMKVAIWSKVDGIILEPDNSPEIKELINTASEQNIPVITVWNDVPDSKRKCYVGADEYMLGKMYGQLINEISEEKDTKIELLLNQTAVNSSESKSKGVQDTVKNTYLVHSSYVDRSRPFSAEEVIQNILTDSDNRPDILVCFDNQDTILASKIVADYNIVGTVSVLGFYEDSVILDDIKKEIVTAAVSIDAYQAGQRAVDILFRCRTEKYINEYEILNIYVINRSNVGMYEKADGEES